MEDGHSAKDASQVVVLVSRDTAKAAKRNSTDIAVKLGPQLAILAERTAGERRCSCTSPISNAENKKNCQRKHAKATKGRSLSYWVHVKTATDLACRVRVLPSYRVATLLYAVKAVTGIVPSRVSLVQLKCGKEIVNGKLTMREAGIVAGDVVVAVPRVRAGLVGGGLHDGFSTSPVCLNDNSVQNYEVGNGFGFSKQAHCASHCEESSLELGRGTTSLDQIGDPDVEEMSSIDRNRNGLLELLKKADNVSDNDEQSKSEENARTSKRMADIQKRLQEQKNAKKRRLFQTQ